jgi:hypothetical protein
MGVAPARIRTYQIWRSWPLRPIEILATLTGGCRPACRRASISIQQCSSPGTTSIVVLAAR